LQNPDQNKPIKMQIMGHKIPSGFYLAAGLTAMAASATLKCLGRKHSALFVGQWAAPILIMGLYNKMVKTQGHD
jgi:hypothetical protein